MSRDDIIRRVEERAEKILADTSKRQPHWLIIGGAAAGLAVLAIFLIFGRSAYSIKNSNNATIIGSANNVTINNHQTVQVWQDLSPEKREEIKEEAIQKFPQIKNIGQGVDWKPVAKWLVEEKGIIHTNPRDLFRNMRKDDDESSSYQ